MSRTVVGLTAVTFVIDLSALMCVLYGALRARSRFAFTAAASIFVPSVNVASLRSLKSSVEPSFANSQLWASIGSTSRLSLICVRRS